MKLLLLSIAVSTGLWANEAGEAMEVPCPGVVEYSQGRLRLPQGCEAQQMGVWLSVERYTDLEIKVSRQEAIIDSQQQSLDMLRKKLNAMYNERVRRNLTDNESHCVDPKLSFMAGSLLAGAVISGGCVLWNLSN